jgi:predicted phosphohydrolase
MEIYILAFTFVTNTLTLAKFVCISDTHGFHGAIDSWLPEADCIIHSGDISSRGKEYEIVTFLSWYSQLPYKHKILIAGNHDWFMEKDPELLKMIMPPNITYLNDSMTIIDGIKIWGSPVQPWFHDWAFNRHRGADIRKHWDLIPEGTDIVVTHGPCYGCGDEENRNFQNVGCHDLWEKVNIIKPKVCVAGHIHEGYGVTEKSGIKFINASILNEHYHVANKPIVFEIPTP